MDRTFILFDNRYLLFRDADSLNNIGFLPHSFFYLLSRESHADGYSIVVLKTEKDVALLSTLDSNSIVFVDFFSSAWDIFLLLVKKKTIYPFQIIVFAPSYVRKVLKNDPSFSECYVRPVFSWKFFIGFFRNLHSLSFLIIGFFRSVLTSFFRTLFLKKRSCSSKGGIIRILCFFSLVFSSAFFALFSLSVPFDPALHVAERAAEENRNGFSTYGYVQEQPFFSSNFEGEGYTTAHLEIGDYSSISSFYVYRENSSFSPFSYVLPSGKPVSIPIISSSSFEIRENVSVQGMPILFYDNSYSETQNSIIVSVDLAKLILKDDAPSDFTLGSIVGTRINFQLGNSLNSSRAFVVSGVIDVVDSPFSALFGKYVSLVNNATRMIGYSGESFYFRLSGDELLNYSFLRKALALRQIYDWSIEFVDNTLSVSSFSKGIISSFFSELINYYSSSYYLCFSFLAGSLVFLFIASLCLFRLLRQDRKNYSFACYSARWKPWGFGSIGTPLVFIAVFISLSGRIKLLGAPYFCYASTLEFVMVPLIFALLILFASQLVIHRAIKHEKQ